MKRALVLRHVDHEGIAGYREPVEAAEYDIQRVAAHHAGCAKLDTMSPDLLVVMGGPMGVYDTDRFPWLIDEIAVIRRRLIADRPTLGICLGSQLIAAAMGVDVRKGPVREIGFAPLDITEAGAQGPLRQLAGVDVLHWHGDTFDVPEGTDLLATTPLYAQAFARGRNVLALQFHAEMGEDDRFEHWLANDTADIAAAGNTAEELRADHDAKGPRAVAAGRAMIAEWLAGLS
ncbi:glutamine amidotransferase [Sphingomonas sp.]|jgi:GMP synthase (glutamine-hydrolysing)|uniref:glutamine amidotransferase n=1 Tax=Sphingomonas sp. TaxID=28214 RepID=UPI002E32BA1A|nr:glutamine amidotransferase [Sphingomonas sp.]HEX4694145.1 glutamine amidotransferase [Sphingomonas sp.]